MKTSFFVTISALVAAVAASPLPDDVPVSSKTLNSNKNESVALKNTTSVIIPAKPLKAPSVSLPSGSKNKTVSSPPTEEPSPKTHEDSKSSNHSEPVKTSSESKSSSTSHEDTANSGPSHEENTPKSSEASHASTASKNATIAIPSKENSTTTNHDAASSTGTISSTKHDSTLSSSNEVESSSSDGPKDSSDSAVPHPGKNETSNVQGSAIVRPENVTLQNNATKDINATNSDDSKVAPGTPYSKFELEVPRNATKMDRKTVDILGDLIQKLLRRLKFPNTNVTENGKTANSTVKVGGSPVIKSTVFASTKNSTTAPSISKKTGVNKTEPVVHVENAEHNSTEIHQETNPVKPQIQEHKATKLRHSSPIASKEDKKDHPDQKIEKASIEQANTHQENIEPVKKSNETIPVASNKKL